jgi:hypothetical protein
MNCACPAPPGHCYGCSDVVGIEKGSPVMKLPLDTAALKDVSLADVARGGATSLVVGSVLGLFLGGPVAMFLGGAAGTVINRMWRSS